MRAANLLLCLLFLPAGSFAADFSDPTWPCIQRKVENLSAGLMWPTPVDKVELTPEAENLATLLALRRVSLEDAERQVSDFVGKTPSSDARLLGNVFQRVFDKLSSDRQRLMSGIARYSESQIRLAQKIDQSQGEMARLTAETNPDFDRIDKLEEQLDWDERIYHDRARALTYVCETPVLLEKRAYAIAQLLLKHVPN